MARSRRGLHYTGYNRPLSASPAGRFVYRNRSVMLVQGIGIYSIKKDSIKAEVPETGVKTDLLGGKSQGVANTSETDDK